MTMMRTRAVITVLLSSVCLYTPAIAGKAYDGVYKGTGITERCMVETEQRFGIHRGVMMAIFKVEGGATSRVSKNSNGSHDLGNFQVNDSVWVPHFKKKFNVTRSDILNKPCINYQAANYILWQYMQKQKYSKRDFWWKVCRYHSGTKKYRKKYCTKLVTSWYDLIREYPELTKGRVSLKRERLPRAEGGVVKNGKVVNMGSHSTLVSHN